MSHAYGPSRDLTIGIPEKRVDHVKSRGYLVSYLETRELEAEPRSDGGFWIYFKEGRQVGRFEPSTGTATYYSERVGMGWKTIEMPNCESLRDAMLWISIKTMKPGRAS